MRVRWFSLRGAISSFDIFPYSLKLLQSTIAGLLSFITTGRYLLALPGVVLLHLLFVPGVAFLTGGAHIWYQNLHPHPTQLNQTLLTIG